MKSEAESGPDMGRRCGLGSEMLPAITLLSRAVSRWPKQSVLVTMETADHIRPPSSRPKEINAYDQILARVLR